MSRRELEQRLGLKRRSVERWETRGQRPADETLLRVAAVLGLQQADVGLHGHPVDRLPLADVLDGLVAIHGPEAVLLEAVSAAFRAR